MWGGSSSPRGMASPNGEMSLSRRSSTLLSPKQSLRAVSLPPALAAAAAQDHSSNAALHDLVATLRQELVGLQDDITVKNQTIVSMGNALAKTRTECQTIRSELAARNEQIQNFTTELASMRNTSQEAVLKSKNAEARVESLQSDLQQSNQIIGTLGTVNSSTEQLQEENSSLKKERDDLQSTMADWKLKVKDALKENRKKEQQMQATEITLRTELKDLQEKLDKATFELQSMAVRGSRPKVSEEVQTDEVTFADDPKFLSAPRGTHRRTLSDQMSLASPTAAPHVTATMDSPPPIPVQQHGASGRRATSMSQTRALSEGRRFPLPLPLSPGARNDPAEMVSPEPPTPPPFIVSIHFGTREGWTLDTKHAVNFGTSVDQLITTCCEMIRSRYGEEVDASTMCLKMNHDKAKRSVTLCGHRELHSFAYFQKLQQKGEMVKLFLEVRDDLQEQVRVHMNPNIAIDPSGI